MKNKMRMLLLMIGMMLLAVPALAAPGDAALFSEAEGGERVISVDSEGDIFYLWTNQALYQWQVGDESPAQVMNGLAQLRYMMPDDQEALGASGFFVADGEFYAINDQQGLVLHLSNQEGQAVVDRVIPLEFDEMVYTETYEGREYTYTQQLNGWQWSSGRLYVILEDWQEGSGEPRLYSFDLKNGQCTAYESEFISKFTPYRDGKLLCMVYDQQNAYDTETNSYKPVQLAVFDPEADALTPLAQIPGIVPYQISAINYDMETDTMYLATPEKLYRMPGMAEPELCAYVPVSYYREYQGNAMARVGQYIMVNGETGVYVRQTDPGYLPKDTLTIYGGYASDAHNAAIARMGDIPVTFYEDGHFSSAQELGQALISGENEIDLLKISLSYMDFQRLMEKGYCYDLTGSKVLSEFAGQLYPFLQEEVMQDGKLMAVPVEMYAYSFGYTRHLKETDFAAPDTFLALCQFLNDWGEQEYYDTYSDYQPFAQTEIQQSMQGMAMELYADYMMATGQKWTLNSPVLREMLEAVSNLDVSDWEFQIDYETATDEDWDELYEKNELFSTYASIDVRYQPDPWEISAPLTMTADSPLCIGTEVTVFFINPRSRHLDAALTYLEGYIQALPQADLAAMCPGRNDPIENPYYEQNLKSYDEQIAQMEESMKTAKEADKTALEEQLASLQEWRAEYERDHRYLATADSIAAYRAIEESFFVRKPNPFYSAGGEELHTLYSRYLMGQISLDQFILEGEAKLRLMLLENQ